MWLVLTAERKNGDGHIKCLPSLKKFLIHIQLKRKTRINKDMLGDLDSA